MMPVTEMFNPKHYEGVRKPLLEAETMPAWCYTSPAFYRREVDRIWRKVWNFIGSVDKSRTRATISRSISPAFRSSSCATRTTKFVPSRIPAGIAAPSCSKGRGNCKLIVCPYHSWTYELDGKLRGTPEMDKTIGFNSEDNRLIPIKLDTWGGFIFITFDDNAPPLKKFLGDLPEKLAPYRLEDMALVRRKVYDMDCNWKLFVENAKESYHIATVHKATINKYASAKSAGYWVEEPKGEYVVTFAQHEGSMALLKGAKGFPMIESTGRPARSRRHLCAADLSEHLSRLHHRLRLVSRNASARAG